MESIGKVYIMKEENQTKMGYAPHYVYLGTDIRPWRHQDADEDEPRLWSIYVYHYINKIITNVHKKLMSHVCGLTANQVSSFIIGCRPELDTSRDLDADNTN